MLERGRCADPRRRAAFKRGLLRGELGEGKLNERSDVSSTVVSARPKASSLSRFLPSVCTSYGTPLRSGRLLSIRAKQVKTTWFLAWFSAVASGPEARTPAPPQLVWQHTLAAESPQ